MLPTKSKDQIAKDLSKEDSTINRELLPHLLNMIRSSASKMAEYWPTWEKADLTYRAIRASDDQDKEAVRKGTPAKTIIPLAYAQVQTAAAFLFDAYASRPELMEFAGVGPEDQQLEQALSKDLNYQVRKSNLLPRIYFNLLDGLKYGIGVKKTDWRVKRAKQRVMRDHPMQQLGSVLGLKFPKVEAVEDMVTYEGNNVQNVSPYSFYPDPSLPVARFQEGDFVAHEEERTLQSLRQIEGYYGLDYVKPEYTQEWLKERPRRSGVTFAPNVASPDKGKVTNLIVLTEVQFVMVPSMWKDKLDLDFGTDVAEKWVAVIANDRRIIKLEPLSYLHGDYTYDVWESSPDHNFFCNEGVIGSIYELQAMVSWFINSHVGSVAQTITNRFIVNPQMVHVEDIENNKRAIRTKPAFTGELNRAIDQLRVVDVTANHMNDVANLMRFIQVTTGVTENAQGIYSTGRRSAAQTRDVNGGAALRLNTIGALHSFNSFEPMARQFLANTRQNRTREIYQQIVGQTPIPFEQIYGANPANVANDFDFKPFRSVSPNEKEQRIQSITDLVGLLLSNPQAIQMLNKDPGKLIQHLAELQGIDDLERFNLATTPTGLNPVLGTQEDVQSALASGGVPVDLFGEQLLKGLNGYGQATTP